MRSPPRVAALQLCWLRACRPPRSTHLCVVKAGPLARSQTPRRIMVSLLLSHASAPGAGEAYAALTASRIMPVTAAGNGARVVLLVPWDALGAPSASADSGQKSARCFYCGGCSVHLCSGWWLAAPWLLCHSSHCQSTVRPACVHVRCRRRMASGSASAHARQIG